MRPIQLHYAKNILSRRAGAGGQELEFSVLVENIAYGKDVDVLWAGEDGVWRVLKAGYHRSAGANGELWRARAFFPRSAPGGLPGNVRFALRYRVSGKEYWDNNDSRDYDIAADSGIMAPPGARIVNIGYRELLDRGHKSCPVTVAVHQSAHPKSLGVVWSLDHWKTRRWTPCSFQRDYWYRTCRSHAQNPNRYGWQVWSCELDIRDAFRVEYAILCDSGEERTWENNFGRNYIAHRERLKVLTLNLHCYQEENQAEKFSLIARAISDLNIDTVCLQEVGEHWKGGAGDWPSNAARIIRERLKRAHHLSFHLHTDWSHIGFGHYREGCAILSRYKFLKVDSGYVSSSHSPYDIHSRKVVTAQVHVPYMGFMNVFSVHLSWWSDGFREQFEKLKAWADGVSNPGSAATLLCGDFNSRAGSEGYALVACSREYEDQFLAAASPEVFRKVYGQLCPNWDPLRDDHRIDYIFRKIGGSLMPVSARVLFTEDSYGRVSDHPGYMVEFEPV